MSKYCSEDCEDTGPVCDFCIYYDFDKQYCTRHNIKKYPDEGCEEFICFTIKDVTEL